MKRIGNLYEIVCSKDTIRKAIHEASKGKNATANDAFSIISRWGWIKHTDSYGFFVKWIKPYISIVRMKNIARRAQSEEVQKRKYGYAAGVG